MVSPTTHFPEVKRWDKKRLEKELADVRYHIANFSFGRYELAYEQALVNELDSRYPL